MSQIQTFKLKDLFNIKIDPDFGIEISEAELLKKIEDEYPYIAHDIKRIDRNIAMIFITDSDQGLYIFLIQHDAIVYSLYTGSVEGYSCSYRVPIEDLINADIITVGEAASVDAFPALSDSSICR